MNKKIAHMVVMGVVAIVCSVNLNAQEKITKVSVVVGKDAPELERFAASELCGYLEKLFDVKAQPVTSPEAGSSAVFLVGSPTTNQHIRSFPQVSDQGIVIQRSQDGLPTMVVGGGAPRATMWAVYELAERWGVRYLLDHDALPSKSKFAMPNLHVVMEPAFRVRAHVMSQDFADSLEAWGLKDLRSLIDQLAKMKYNRLDMFPFAWQPYLAYQVDGIKRQTATLWYGYHYPITPGMPGRAAFPPNATEFWNTDLPLHGSPDELISAGVKLEQAILEHGQRRGMECVVNATISEYPKEFAPLLGGAVPIHMMNQLTTTPGPETRLDDLGLHMLSSTVVRTTIDTYPRADRVNISINEWRQWTDQYQRAWDALDAKYHIGQITTLDHVLDASQHRIGYNFTSLTKAQLDKKAADEVKGDLASLYFFDWLVKDSGAVTQSKRPDMKFLYWGFAEELFPILPKVLPPNSELEVMPDNFLDHLLQRPDILKALSGGPIQPIISLTMDDDNIGIIPQLTTSSLQKVLQILRETGWEGFVARERFPGDHDTEMAYMARAAWDPDADPDRVASEQLKAACGEACGADLLTTVHSVDAATHVWEQNDEHFTFPVPGMLMKYWKAEPLPAYLEENRKNYEAGWKAAQHALLVSSPIGKDYAEYWVKRMQFSVNYIEAIQLVRQAAGAEAAHRNEQAAKNATAALATLRESIDAYASVARNQTDRGAIAVAVEYGYRPLEKKVAELKQRRTME